jgi:hypothetical protein
MRLDRIMRPHRLAILAAVVVLLPAAPALAAAPPNDSRAAAEQLSLPASVSGTLVDATNEPDEPGDDCGATKASVWYRITAAKDERVVVRAAANGDLDATLAVFLRQRSQTTLVDCDATDEHGDAGVSFRAQAGSSYLVRVAQLSNSVADRFTLEAFAPQPAPTPPGQRLRSAGVKDSVDSLQDTEDAWSVRLRAGVTYRVNLSTPTDACTRLEIYDPGTTSFSDEPVDSEPCSGYGLLTPERSGRYSLLVRAAPRVHGAQRYHLQVAPVGADDIAPGHFIGNFARVRGSLQGRRVDVVDLYRFDVTTRSDLTLTLNPSGEQAFDVVLLSDRGHRIRCGCGETGGAEIEQRLRPGRYFAAVIAENGATGRYTLRRVSRTITRTRIAIDGSGQAQQPPGAAARITVSVSPGAAGPVTIFVERFDPLAGWLPARRMRATASGGVASVSFVPPAEGRWRARAEFAGTHAAAPSHSGFAYLLVAGPLRE